MSNIYDALEKGGGGSKRPPGDSPLEPLTPREGRGASLPGGGKARVLGGSREQELESLRQRILLELDTTRSCMVSFSGAVPGEGSSTLALLFARELAHWEERPVLLVDADIAGYPRSLSGALKEAADGLGFSDVLEGKSRLEEAVRSTELANLHFLPRGSNAGSPLDLLSSERLATFRREVDRHYAFSILDTSPLLFAPESGLIGAGTDGMVLVVRANRTRREIVQKAIRLINQARGRALGVVLNERRYPIPGFIYRRL